MSEDAQLRLTRIELGKRLTVEGENGKLLRERDELKAELSMRREGICPADVATMTPDYMGPDVTCETCPDRDGCTYRHKGVEKLEATVRTQHEELAELRTKLRLAEEDAQHIEIIELLQAEVKQLREGIAGLPMYGLDEWGHDLKIRDNGWLAHEDDLQALLDAGPGEKSAENYKAKDGDT